jgi:hypothetical protein
MPTGEILETGAAALLFAIIFLVGGQVRPLRALVRDDRSLISFGAGMASAYVFVHAIPELHVVRLSFAASVSVTLRYEGMAIYFVALVGFLVFYGLDHRGTRLQRETTAEGQGGPAFRFHVGGFAAYVWLMAYLLVNSLEETRVSIALYAVAIAFHFLAVDHSLRSEHGSAYERTGRYVLAGSSLFGWGAGLVFALPQYGLALLVAFTSGAIIMNSAIMELPTEKDGRFLPFMIGGLVYGLILLPFG